MRAEVKTNDIINEFLGAPYKHGGRSIDGLDCYGLIIKVYQRLGCELFDVSEIYGLDWSNERNLFIENCHRQWRRVEAPDLFDVVLLRSKGSCVDHAGIFIGQSKFIHTCKAGTVIARLGEWQDKIEGFYRFNGNGQIHTEHIQG